MSIDNTTPPGDSAESGKQLRAQLLPNSTPVPNWFFDKVLTLAGLRDAEKWTFLVVWRKTVGWQKTADFVSVSQIQKGARTRREYAAEAGQLWEAAGVFQRDRCGLRGMIRYRVNPNIDGAKVVRELERLVAGRNQFPRGTSIPAEPEPVPGGTRTSSRAELTESKGSKEQTPLASDDAGTVSHDDPKPDPRFAAVKDLYIRECEKRNPDARAVFDGSDGKALKSLLEQQPGATVEKLNGWLRNAFQSDDVPPLRRGFRFRQFAGYYTQYVNGALRSEGARQPQEALSRKEVERRRNELSPEAQRQYKEIGVRPS
jgi:hypothetical protein